MTKVAILPETTGTGDIAYRAIAGLTPIGRATVARLQMNTPTQ